MTSSSSSNNGIVVRGLVKQFRKGPRAVDEIELDVAPGEIYGFLGPNGAGKSTTVNMLVTLLPPTSGTALVAGWNIATEGAQVRRAIGAALQAVALDKFLTGREHLHLIGSLQGITGSRAAARADELLARVGLEDAADRKVGGYSGGMQRRLDLALALVHEPRVLFLDEPTTGLDPQSRTALWEEVRRLADDDGVTVFLTTQYLEEADVLADRVGIIDAGRIVAEGTPTQLKATIGAPTVEVTPCSDADRAALPAVLDRFGELVPAAVPGAVAVRLSGGSERSSLVTIVRAIDESALRILEIRQHEPTLDDVFLAKTGRSLEGAAGEAAIAETVA
jgi:ABC-2 type transport system ATP-binding protein